MGRIFKQLTITDRRKIEKMLAEEMPAKYIADKLRVNVSTVYRELKRGRYVHRNSDWTEEVRYSADIAEGRYQENLKAKGPALKIGKDIALANYIEEKIADEGTALKYFWTLNVSRWNLVLLLRSLHYISTYTMAYFYEFPRIILLSNVKRKDIIRLNVSRKELRQEPVLKSVRMI